MVSQSAVGSNISFYPPTEKMEMQRQKDAIFLPITRKPKHPQTKTNVASELLPLGVLQSGQFCSEFCSWSSSLQIQLRSQTASFWPKLLPEIPQIAGTIFLGSDFVNTSRGQSNPPGFAATLSQSPARSPGLVWAGAALELCQNCQGFSCQCSENASPGSWKPLTPCPL